MLSEVEACGKRPDENVRPVRDRAAGPQTAHDLPGIRGLPVELAALRPLVPPLALRWALLRARSVGVGGDEVLLAAGLVTPDAVAAAQARHLGLKLEDGASELILPEEAVTGALRAGHAFLRTESGPVTVAAVRGKALRQFVDALTHGTRPRWRFTAPERLRAAIARHGAGTLAREAADGLRLRHPHLSAATIPHGIRLAAPLALGLAVLLAAANLAPAGLRMAALGVLSALFLCTLGLRLASCLIPRPVPAAPRLPDRDLPVYSLLVPLYREAAVVPRLVAALGALDYPREKLDIKLILEPDDHETRAAIAAAGLPPWFEVITAPPVGPRTKPKALNAALPFARGPFVAVFDAEDVPDPGQLRVALARFQRGGPKLACVQARLVVENAREAWITRHFAVEYCAQFDVLLPALGAMSMPILLGGTSNHFRRAALESAGGWDAYNVTEDADLGLRLTRLGWDIGVIASDTLEEAPVTIGAWMRQRTRWMKGWAQTLIVHARAPRRLLRDMGPLRMLVALLLTAGPFIAMTVHPVSLAAVLHHLWTRPQGHVPPGWVEIATLALCYVNLFLGYGVTAALTLVGLARRGRLREAAILLTLPFYLLLQSLAVWRALADLVRDPHRWDKTEHGMSGALDAPQVTSPAAGPQPLPPPGAWH